MKEYIRNNKRHILTVIATAIPIIVFYLVLGCPLRFFTGICCPGCGMTRALFYFLKLDFAAAYHMHPLILIMPMVALIYIFRNKIPRKLYIVLAALFFFLMGATYIYRLFSGSDVVYIDPSRGFISKMLQVLLNAIKQTF